METIKLGLLIEHFALLPDPRVDRTKRHLLLDIVVIAVCAVICGADTWVDIDCSGYGHVSSTRRSAGPSAVGMAGLTQIPETRKSLRRPELPHFFPISVDGMDKGRPKG